MNPQLDPLISYIKQCQEQGMSEHTIRQTLHQHNWDSQLINQAFRSIRSQQMPTPEASAAPQKYRLATAITDTFKAMRTNLKTFLLASIIIYIGSILLFVIPGTLLTILLIGLLISQGDILIAVIGLVLLYTVWQTLANAVIMAVTSTAVYHGGEGRKSALAEVFAYSLSRLVRLIGASLLLFVIVVWPAVFIGTLPFLTLLDGSLEATRFTLLTPLAIVGSIAWIVIALLRYALVPYVILFEPEVRISKAFGRSKYLLSKGGQWFMAKYLALVIVVTLLLQAFTDKTTSTELSETNNIGVIIVMTLLTAIANGILVTLYRNRRAVRG